MKILNDIHVCATVARWFKVQLDMLLKAAEKTVAERAIEAQPIGSPTPGPGEVRNPNGARGFKLEKAENNKVDIVNLSKGGNGADYLAARIARDAPEILEKVKAALALLHGERAVQLETAPPDGRVDNRRGGKFDSTHKAEIQPDDTPTRLRAILRAPQPIQSLSYIPSLI